MSSRNENFAVLVDAACASFPARPALFHHDGDRCLSHGDLAALVDGWASALRLRGVGPGRNVAIWLPNSPAFVAAFLATLRLGAIAAPLGVLLKAAEVRSRLAIAQPAVLVTTPAQAREVNDEGTSVP